MPRKSASNFFAALQHSSVGNSIGTPAGPLELRYNATVRRYGMTIQFTIQYTIQATMKTKRQIRLALCVSAKIIADASIRRIPRILSEMYECQRRFIHETGYPRMFCPSDSANRGSVSAHSLLQFRRGERKVNLKGF